MKPGRGRSILSLAWRFLTFYDTSLQLFNYTVDMRSMLAAATLLALSSAQTALAAKAVGKMEPACQNSIGQFVGASGRSTLKSQDNICTNFEIDQ